MKYSCSKIFTLIETNISSTQCNTLYLISDVVFKKKILKFTCRPKTVVTKYTSIIGKPFRVQTFSLRVTWQLEGNMKVALIIMSLNFWYQVWARANKDVVKYLPKEGSNESMCNFASCKLQAATFIWVPWLFTIFPQLCLVAPGQSWWDTYKAWWEPVLVPPGLTRVQ